MSHGTWHTAQDPEVEGERVLHELDTLPPKQLFDTVLSVGLATGVLLLGAAKGAALPAVSGVLARYHRWVAVRGTMGALALASWERVWLDEHRCMKTAETAAWNIRARVDECCVFWKVSAHWHTGA